jgi:uncharacterized protein (TIGR02466 family)
MQSGQGIEFSGVKLWPTMIFSARWEELDRFGKPLIEHLIELKSQQANRIDSGVAVDSKSQQGLYESNFDLFLDPHPSVANLVRFISNAVATAVAIANDRQVDANSLVVEYVDSWYHISNEGGFHDAHFHHGCSWCGIFYLQVGNTGRQGSGAPNGGSRFYSPLGLGGGYRDFGNKYLHSSVDPKVEDGMLLIFPSYLLHSGLPYRGDVDRIVIAFNAQIFLDPASASKLPG